MENVADIYPLTPTQQGILYHTLQAPDSEVYFEQIRCTLTGSLSADTLAQAWQLVVDRHPTLRTAFLWDGLDAPLQVVRQTVTVPWEMVDWRAETGDLTKRLDQLAASYRQQGFDLGRAPIMTLVLVQLDDDRHHFIWNTHHLLMDGWSTHLVFKEAFDAYEALMRGEQPALPPVRPFRHHIAWLKKQSLADTEAFWRQQLGGFSAPTPFNVDKRNPATANAFAETTIRLSAETTTALHTLARQQRLTLSTLVQGAWAVLLSRYSREKEVVFGTTLSGRPAELPGVEQMVGMFINTLPMRAQIDNDQPLLAWLQALQTQQLAIRQVEFSSLAQVQKWSDVPAGQPLFESILVFENYPSTAQDPSDTLRRTDLRYRELSNYPLALMVVPSAELEFMAVSNPNRFDSDTIARLLGHLATLLTAMAQQPNQTLGELTMLTSAEIAQLHQGFNPSTELPPADQPIYARVADHARTTPDALAVVDPTTRLTYAELNRRANQLAHRLQAAGVTANTPVGLFAERSAEMLIGIVGIQKAGGAYVPLDPAYPAERIALVLDDTQAPVVVTQAHLADRLPAHATLLPILPDAGEAAPISAEIDPPAVSLDDLAYLIYTSGSTGRPKGVMVSHHNLLGSTQARKVTYDEAVGRYLLLSSFAFDSSVAGIFWTLLDGGTLVLPAPGDEKDIAQLADLIEREQVTHTLALPSLYRLLLDFAPAGSLDSLRAVIVAGEACPPDLSGEHHARLPQTALFNEYGPTEATVWCSVYQLPRIATDGPVPIGRPTANCRIHILDERQQPVPIGVPGELVVGGEGVTQGYWQNEALTAERFVSLPDLGRVYRTGDLARWRPDGNIEFLGRVDNQVKLRGFRIELGEIEAALMAQPRVREAVVVVWQPPSAETTASDKQLVAYVVGDPTPDPDALKAALADALPDYMLPRHVLPLDALPRTPNGKVDRQRLPDPPSSALSTRTLTPPRTDAEKTLAAIWCDVLRLPEVGIHDKFFELGGDSILSIQAIARARKAGLALTPRQLFKEQTIARLAALASAEIDTPAAASTRAQSGPAPLTPIQHWFFEQRLANPDQWNQATWFDVTTALNKPVLEAALGHLIAHHPMLRARFRQQDGRWVQQIEPADKQPRPRPIPLTSLAHLDSAEQVAALQAAADAAHASLDLANGPILQAKLFDLSRDRPPRLLLVIHHLCVDAVSWGILTADWLSAYQQLSAGEPVSLPPAAATPADWAHALTDLATESRIQQDVAYWQTQLADVVALPRDATTASNDNREGQSQFVTARLDAPRTAQLQRDVHRAYFTRIDDVLLTALGRALARWSGEAHAITLEGHGRDPDALSLDLDLSQTVGWFTTLSPLRLETDLADDLGTTLRAVKEQLRARPHGGLSYGMARYLADDATREKLATLPQPEILFNYLGRGQAPDAQALLHPRSDAIGAAYAPENERAHLIDVNARVIDGQLEATWQFAPSAFSAETIHQLAESFTNELAALGDHCMQVEEPRHTPADFPLATLTQAELDAISAEVAAPIAELTDLTPMQALMLLYVQMNSGEDVLFNQFVYRLSGPLDAERYRQAWQHLVERHDALRTRFHWQPGRDPLQIVVEQATLPWQTHDWRGLDSAEQAQRLQTLLADDRAAGFDFAQPPLMRLTLVQRADDEHWLVWSSHHLIVDRWCIGILFEESAIAYDALVANKPINLPPAPRYRDYIAWLKAQDEAAARATWRNLLADATPRPLPLNAPKTASNSAETSTTHHLKLSAETTAALQQFASAHDLTLGNLVVGAWAVVVASATKANDALFGLTISGRPPELDNVASAVGCFINNVPLRVTLDPNSAVAAWLQRLQESQFALQTHGYASPAQIQEWSGMASGSALFDSLVVVQAPVHHAAPKGIAIGYDLGDLQAGYPIAVGALPQGDTLQLSITSDSARVADGLAQQLMTALHATLIALPDAANVATLHAQVELDLPTGKVEERDRISAEMPYAAPETDTEATLAAIWADILDVERVGRDDNFFALGGHSLNAMQLLKRIHGVFEVDLPVQTLFEEPTVAQIGVAISVALADAVDDDELADLLAELEAAELMATGDER